MITGTIAYWRFEDWTIIQALYFSVVTLTTVGYRTRIPKDARASSSWTTCQLRA